MRRSHDYQIISDTNGNVAGLNLGADYCAEHEHGIKDIEESFGLKTEQIGIAKRSATLLPEKNIFYKEGKKGIALVFSDDYSLQEFIKAAANNLERALSNYYEISSSDNLNCAWDERGFGVYAKGQKEKEILKKIYEGIKRMDFAVWTGGGGVFKNAGLCLAVPSLIDEINKKKMLDADQEYLDLKNEAEKIGIEKRLKDAGKKWYALSPKWASDFKDFKPTQYKVVFWLNPEEQRKYNRGWMRVEDLENWINGTGICIKKQEASV